YPNDPNAATNSAVAPPDCQRIAGLVVAYQTRVGADATPIRIPKIASSTVAAVADRRAAKFMISSTTNAAIQETITAPCDRFRPAYAPSAKNAAVSATSPMVCANSVCVRPGAAYP